VPAADPLSAPVAAATTTAAGGAAGVLARMSLAQRVGQLFMVGTPATLLTTDVVHAIQADHVGNVMLTGRSTKGVAATAKVAARLQKLVTVKTTAGVPLFVGTDQEGGLVQVLRGPGFSTIPAALTQGGWSAASVRAYAKKWGGQLRAAGVDVDLAPVLDTVPSAAAAADNPPVGFFKREYGFTPALVSSRGGAFAAGLGLAGVDAAVKHFPGLGRVTANTDVTAGVTDRVTRRGDPYLAPFAAAVKAGVPFVMMSTAIYAKIDPNRPAAFSKTVIGTVLRGDLKFRGVVISDDLGNAKQVAAWTPGARAVDFLRAGGDMVLTVNGSLLQPMYAAVLAKAQTDPVFRAQVNASALRVLTAKQKRALILPVHNPIGWPPLPASARQ
jgi:beta-N-acetylhexosaminidase